jgi:hypothetical protein
MALSNMDGNSKDRGLLYNPFYRQAGNAWLFTPNN